jgi:hypothetical protein
MHAAGTPPGYATSSSDGNGEFGPSLALTSTPPGARTSYTFGPKFSATTGDFEVDTYPLFGYPSAWLNKSRSFPTG